MSGVELRDILYRRDRYTWVAFLMVGFFAYLQAVLGPLMPFLMGEMQLSYTVAGFHFTAFAAGMVVSGALADRIISRAGRYPVFWLGAGAMASGAAGIAGAVGPEVSVASALVMGVGGGAFTVIIPSSLSDLHGGNLTVAITEANLTASVFASMAPLIVGIAQLTWLGWRAGLYAAIGFLALVAVIGFGTRIPALPKGKEGSDTSSIPRPLPTAFKLYWVIIVVIVSIEWCMIYWGAVFLESHAGLTDTHAALAMTVFLGAIVAGRLAGSILTRRIPSGRLMAGSLALVALGFPGFWMGTGPAATLGGLGLVGLGVSNLFPLALAQAMLVTEGQRDQSSSRITMAVGMALLSAPLLLGWLGDHYTIRSAYGVVAVLIVACIGLVIAAERMARQEGAERG